MTLGTVRAGNSEVSERDGEWHLQLPPADGYANAQLDDTRGLGRRSFAHRPPLRFSVEARASSVSPTGTLGFGFWNDPFPAVSLQAGAGRLLPAAPQAIWFFHASDHSDLPFAAQAAGSGWRACCLGTPPLSLPVLGLLGTIFAAGMTIRRLRGRLLRRFWATASGLQSLPLPGLDQWHEYRIDWSDEAAVFRLDGRRVLESPRPPQGPLGLVIWIDNQWASLSEARGLRFGVAATHHPQWLKVRRLRLNDQPIPVDRAQDRGHGADA